MAQRKKSSARSTIAKAAETMGAAVGKAVSALESAVSSPRRPNGYEKVRMKDKQAAPIANDGAGQPRSNRARTTTTATSKKKNASSSGRSRKATR